MSILQRYFFASILQAVAFALAALLGLQAFMDLTGELPAVGKNGYGMQHAALFVLTMLPQHVTEVLPVASLLGTIYTMAQFASLSSVAGSPTRTSIPLSFRFSACASTRLCVPFNGIR